MPLMELLQRCLKTREIGVQDSCLALGCNVYCDYGWSSLSMPFSCIPVSFDSCVADTHQCLILNDWMQWLSLRSSPGWRIMRYHSNLWLLLSFVADYYPNLTQSIWIKNSDDSAPVAEVQRNSQFPRSRLSIFSKLRLHKPFEVIRCSRSLTRSLPRSWKNKCGLWLLRKLESRFIQLKYHLPDWWAISKF